MASLIKTTLPFLGVLGAVVLVAGGIVLLARAGEAPAATPQAGAAEKTGAAERTAVAEKDVMPGETAPAEDSAGIPPIDAAAPAEIETATFALG